MKASLKLALLAMSLMLLSGCFGTMSNRVYCSVDNTEMIGVSKYGPVGISHEVEQSDALIFCRGALIYNALNGGKR